MNSDRACIRTDLHRVTLIGCSGGCQQGDRPCDCIASQTELCNVIPLRADFPAPKGKPMDNYRRDSGAWTGFAPRSVEQRWPSPPRAIEPGWFVRLVRRIFGR